MCPPLAALHEGLSRNRWPDVRQGLVQSDALHLAAALVLSDFDPGTLPFVTLDDRLAQAARREGFEVLGA